MGTDPVESLEREIGMLLRRARSFSGQLARQVHPDLEPGAYGILLRLADTGGARLTDLAGWFGVGKPTMSRQVAVLERFELVERRDDPSDARAQLISLTELGGSRLGSARTARRDRFRSLLDAWPGEDVQALGDLLHRFNAQDD